jgi:hypothetical protein
MSGTTSFLFSGQPVPPQPTGSDTQTNFPLWLQQYQANLGSAATNLANTPYNPFPGPQVAAPSADTQQAWQMAQNNVGNYQGALGQAMNLTGQAGTPVTSGQIQNYMNPFENTVLGGLQSAANTNLTQNILPQVQDRFVSAGQSRSPQEMQATNNAVQANDTALYQAQAGALGQGYQGALGAALQEQGAQQTAGAQFGQLGALTQQLGAADTGQLAAAGQAQDTNNQANINAAMNNFYSQQQWPYQNLAYASNIIRGQNVPSNTMTVGQQYSPGQSYTASPLSSFVGTTLGSNAVGVKKGGHIRRARGGALSHHLARAA